MTNEFEDDAPNVAGWEPTLPLRAPEATVDVPDTAQNVIAPPTRTWASIANDYAGIYSDEALSQPYAPNPNRYDATAPIGGTLGRIGSLLTGTPAPESAPGIVREATRPLNYFPIGRGVAGVAKGAGAAFSAYGGSQLGEELTEGKGDTAEALGGAVGSLVGGIGGLKGLNKTALGALAKEEVGGIRLGRDKKPTAVVAQAADELTDPVKALLGHIKEARPLEAQNMELLHKFRQRQAGAFAGALREGEEGFNAALGAMRGQADRVGFTPLRPLIGKEGVDELFTSLNRAGLRQFEHASAGNALRNVMDGVVPAPSELTQLERAFPGITKSLSDAKIIQGPGLGEYLKDLLSVPQSLKSSFDISNPRQLATSMAAHPRKGAESFGKSVKALLSEGNFESIHDDLARRWYRSVPSADPNTGRTVYRDLMADAGVAKADLDVGLTPNERTFIAKFINRIPGYRQTQRAYVTGLNVMRDGVFQHMLKGYGGNPAEIPDETLRQWGRLVNVATGRGDLRELSVLGHELIGSDPISKSNIFGTPIFWAPRLVMSRMQLPFELLSSNAQVRKEAARQLAAFVSVNSMLVGIGAAAGLWETEFDPRSADFGQIKIKATGVTGLPGAALGAVGFGTATYDGYQRIDPWAGFRPLANAIARLSVGEVKSTSTGEVFDKKRGQIILDFLRTKFSPVVQIGASGLTGETAIGEEYTGGKFIEDAFLPLFLGDIKEALMSSDDEPAGGRPQRPQRPSRPRRPSRPQRPSRN